MRYEFYKEIFSFTSVAFGLSYYRITIYLITVSQSCGGGGGGNSSGCSYGNSSTDGYFYFGIADVTSGGCSTPFSNGRMFLGQAQIQDGMSFSGTISGGNFCQDFLHVHLVSPTVFKTRRPDQSNKWSCVGMLTRPCGGANQLWMAVVNDDDISVWGGNDINSAIFISELLRVS